MTSKPTETLLLSDPPVHETTSRCDACSSLHFGPGGQSHLGNSRLPRFRCSAGFRCEVTANWFIPVGKSSEYVRSWLSRLMWIVHLLRNMFTRTRFTLFSMFSCLKYLTGILVFTSLWALRLVPDGFVQLWTVSASILSTRVALFGWLQLRQLSTVEYRSMLCLTLAGGLVGRSSTSSTSDLAFSQVPRASA